jgi:hypothetical protein
VLPIKPSRWHFGPTDSAARITTALRRRSPGRSCRTRPPAGRRTSRPTPSRRAQRRAARGRGGVATRTSARMLDQLIGGIPRSAGDDVAHQLSRPIHSDAATRRCARLHLPSDHVQHLALVPRAVEVHLVATIERDRDRLVEHAPKLVDLREQRLELAALKLDAEHVADAESADPVGGRRRDSAPHGQRPWAAITVVVHGSFTFRAGPGALARRRGAFRGIGDIRSGARELAPSSSAQRSRSRPRPSARSFTRSWTSSRSRPWSASGSRSSSKGSAP